MQPFSRVDCLDLPGRDERGAWFFQKVQWEGLRAGDPVKIPSMGGGYSAEALAILKREGPKYQYGAGCLADGVLGDWIARCCGGYFWRRRTRTTFAANSVSAGTICGFWCIGRN